MAITKQASGELKSRVNSCIDKLSDRDTHSMAGNELEAIARTLPHHAFAPFLNCLSATDSSDKSHVRRQCVRLITVLSAAHGDALSPHVSRMISVVLRRLRDPDSAVQSACVDAVASVAAHVSSAPFTVIMKPLVDTLFQEQDMKPQIGAALCVAAAVEAAAEPDLAELRKLLPRALKFVKSDSCKGKAALLSLLGSIVRSDCVKNKNLLSSMVSTAVECLSSEDWAARKEAADVLEKVAVSCTSLAAEMKPCAVAALESRRFDKVKLVREKMNRVLEIWKDLPTQSEVESESSSSWASPAHWQNVGSMSWETPKVGRRRSPSSSSSSSRKSISDNKPSTIPTSTRRNNCRAQLLPFHSNTNKFNHTQELMMDLKDNIISVESEEEFQEMSLIRRQLQQIENQQSNLLHLLQRFMGRSKKGMSSLEQRVEGLEKVLVVMSRDFGISTEPACCIMPGVPSFWRKAEARDIHS